MAYYNEDQLLKYFELAMKDVSNKEKKALEDDIKRVYSLEMSKVMDVLTVKHNLEQSRALREVQVFYQEKINLIGQSYDKQLMDARQSLMSTIFDEVTSKLKHYMMTQDYAVTMFKKIQSLKKEHASKVTIYVNTHDQILFNYLNEHLDSHDSVLAHPDFTLGGFIALFKDKRFEYDHTFDTLLNEQKRWFTHEAKLFIRS